MKKSHTFYVFFGKINLTLLSRRNPNDNLPHETNYFRHTNVKGFVLTSHKT